MTTDGTIDATPAPSYPGFPAERFEAIIRAVAAGLPTWRALKENGDCGKEFYHALADPALSQRYARAKLDGLDMLADEMLSLSDQCRVGERVTTKRTTIVADPDADAEGEAAEGVTLPAEETTVVTADMVERARLQIDTRKWLLSKLAPKKYGDMLQLEHSGTLDNAATLEAARKRKRSATG